MAKRAAIRTKDKRPSIVSSSLYRFSFIGRQRRKQRPYVLQESFTQLYFFPCIRAIELNEFNVVPFLSIAKELII